ncbi:DivIVA domain-containing protein [Nocardioides koreensis]
MNSTAGDHFAAPAPDRLTHPSFTTVMFREGYAREQVDAFILRAAQSLDAPTPVIRPEDVRAVQFAPVRLREGYDMAEVDAYLDELEQHLAERVKDQPQPSPALAAEPGDGAPTAGARLRLAWQDSTVSGRIAGLGMGAGLLVGLLVGLWPGDPSTRTALVFGLIGGTCVAGLVVVALQVASLAVGVGRIVAYVVRGARRR